MSSTQSSSQRPASSQAHPRTPLRHPDVHHEQRSSRFALTPRFAGSSTQRPSHLTRLGVDDLEDDDDNDQDELPATVRDGLDEGESADPPSSFDELLTLHERRQKYKALAVGRGQLSEDDEDASDAVGRHYAQKRRKLEATKDAIYVSSSPSPASSPVLSDTPTKSDDLPVLKGQDYASKTTTEGAQVEETEDEDMAVPDPSLSRILGLPKSERKPTLPHFQSAAVEPMPFSPPAPPARPSFMRPSVPSRATSTAAVADTANLLPDAFSPSKRRGRTKDYLHGGMAETMVDWILGMGQEEETRARHLQQNRGRERAQAARSPEYERVVHVVEIRRDESDPGVVIRGHDGDIYLLAGSPANMTAGGEGQSVDVGSRVGLRKGKLSWGVHLNDFHGTTDSEGDSGQRFLTVSALWDLDPS